MSVHVHEQSALPNVGASAAADSELKRILDLARWAPSGDNIQPWRFEILSEDRVVVHIVGDDNIYEFNKGQGTALSTGVLLETIRIAASRYGRGAEWTLLDPVSLTMRISIDLSRRDGLKEDPLCQFVESRSVERRAYRTTPLSAEQKDRLKQAVGEEFAIQWYESDQERRRTARINALATDIRLRIRQAYDVHRRIIDWDRDFSPTAIPAKAIGLDALTLKLMRWAMVNWKRADLMNRIFGTMAPQMQLDLHPGFRCGAHFTIRHRNKPAPGDERVALLRAGQAIQRFWLTATQMSLAMQPALAALCFATYAAYGGLPSDIPPAITRKVQNLADKLRESEGFDPAITVFRGRIGWPAPAAVKARSTRRDTTDLTA
ncbi:MAG TPA: nitroreductase family protein [Micropepsaceae bacterium]|jgi:nitroreductase|nr:nitroreductase family protein [Micropepsaceae bacterium]